MKQLLVFTSFLLCIHVCAQNDQSQNKRYIENQIIEHLEETISLDSKITKFLFKKVDKNRRVVLFTLDDVLLLEQFFLNQEGVLACKSHVIDKQMQIISRSKASEGKALFDYKEVVPALRSMGYVVIGMRCKEEVVTFEAKYKPVEIELAKLTNNETDPTKKTVEEDCDDCGRVGISKDLLNQFKNIDYGEDLIEFNLDIPSNELSKNPN